MTDTYLKNGKEIFDNFCSTAGNQPTMLPRAPEQTYIDIYPDEDQPGPSFRDDKRHQSDYETEVKMYRALEGLDGNYIVLHSFKNTHEQYRMCDKNHDKRCNECTNKLKFQIEGECDFLIICSNSFVVIEVKNMEHVHNEDWEPECTTRDKQLKALIGTYTKSVKQRNKVAKLIRCIDNNANILQFTAYPNFSKQFKDQFQLSVDELSTIIFEEDIICRKGFKDLIKSSNHSVTTESTSLTEQTYPKQNCFSRLVSCFSRCCNKATDTDNISAFAAWWAHNVTQATPSVRRVSKESVSSTEIIMPVYNQDSHEKVKFILLAIWATQKKKCVQSKCSLGKCIMDINEKLKKGHIIFEPQKNKKRATNPDVVTAPFFKYVGVQNLTTQQYSVFNSNENLMWINGPAGTGKTVILCSKIIELLIQSDGNNKVVVFKFTGEGNNSQHYQCALDQYKLDQYKLISSDKYEHTPAEFGNLITESVCRVIIVEVGYINTTDFTNKLSELSGYHVFVDDIQCMFRFHTTVEQRTDLIDRLIELSINQKVWIEDPIEDSMKHTKEKKVWIACDIAQLWSFFYPRDNPLNLNSLLIDKLDTNQRRILTKNLRNTCDLANILSVVRDQLRGDYVKSYSPESGNLDLVLPTQSQGHFIHGPLTVIHVFNDFNPASIVRVFNTELDKLCAEFKYSDMTSGEHIGVVHTVYNSDVIPLVRDSVYKRCNNTVKIAVCYSYNSSSAEWPAVVVLCKVWDYKEAGYLTSLYLALSRARVHCTVIIYPMKGQTLDSKPSMLPLLDRLSNYARIIRY